VTEHPKLAKEFIKMTPNSGLLISGFVVFLAVRSTEGLSCPPGARSGPSSTPVCCLSGYLTTDACGTREVCAKAENDMCGGPWNTRGRCARNLQCLVRCPCFAKGADPKSFPDPGPNPDPTHFPGQCIFPFKYKGKQYDSCTTDHSENGKAWCPYVVDPDNNVVEGKWGDCEGEGCGLEKEASCKDFDFNYEGKCVPQSAKSAIIGSFGKPSTYNLRDGIREGKKIQKCRTKPQEEQCRCVNKSNCRPPIEGSPFENDDYFDLPDLGWCFLENIFDPSEPSSYCFDDVIFSRRHGRFYSSKACDPNQKPLDKEFTFDFPVFDSADEPPPPPPPSVLEQ